MESSWVLYLPPRAFGLWCCSYFARLHATYSLEQALSWCLILKLVREVVNRRDFLPFHLGQPPSSQTSRHDFEKRPGHDNLQDNVPMTLLDVRKRGDKSITMELQRARFFDLKMTANFRRCCLEYPYPIMPLN
ncbi:hypothetical protein Naga_100612g3 [Nannochloropsis gaditana]|uniref:Uncharacterized protein n=1 Tax=Nannochloropsis gaditana TaxID=72520 RepID=W7TMM7_9STRA|nr:hypothetical protein Naga_100612g3 [Nannochloropsis gaditana]